MKYFLPLLLILTACEKETIEQNPVRPVITEEVLISPPEFIARFSGFTKSKTSIDASFKVPGRIDARPISVGDKLVPGDLIASLEKKDFVLELQQAEAALNEALAEAKNNTAAYKRIKLLYESESASRNELDQARALFEASSAAVERAQKGVELAKERLKDTELFARDNCTVFATHKEVRETISVGEAVASITCGPEIEVEVSVPENYIGQMKRKETVEIRVNALPDVTLTGWVKEIGNVAYAGTTFPVTIALDQVYPNLRAGMAAVVSFKLSTPDKKSMIIVPQVAVGEDKEGNYVYLFEEGTAKKRYVKVGGVDARGIEIVSGLKSGELIITAGIRYLEDGRKVKLMQSED